MIAPVPVRGDEVAALADYVRPAATVPEAIAPISSASGRTVHVVDGHPVTVWPFVAGEWADRANRRHFEAAAALLARVHRTLAAEPVGPPPGKDRRPGDTSDLTDHRLDEWLRHFERGRLQRHPLHGDYYPGNVLAAGDRLVGLLDWDEAFEGMPEREAGLRRSGNAAQPPGSDDDSYATAQVAAFHDLAPR